MTKKRFATIGMIVSILIVLMGILVISGAFGGDGDYPGSAPSYYDSGYASFGGDFYTYVNNNAGEAASAARTTARNLDTLNDLAKNVCGIFLMGFGLMGLCAFGIVRCSYTAPVAVAAKSEDAAEEPSAPCVDDDAPEAAEEE